MMKFKPILDDQIIAYEEKFLGMLCRPRTKDVFEDNDKIISTEVNQIHLLTVIRQFMEVEMYYLLEKE